MQNTANQNITKTQAIKNFLLAKTHKDLADLYNEGMEVQVNAAQDGGERVENEYKGKMWRGYSDGISTWKSFRIPFKANTTPEYTDSNMTWDLSEHAEAIGMTGWDWKHLRSRWVAFDFDAIVGHSDKHTAKLTDQQMQAVMDAATKLDFVTVRRSTGGKGLHLYVFFSPIECKNHTEHAALARAILGHMSALTGFDFNSHVDVCGGNMWVWGRKMLGTNGLELVKQGSLLEDIPVNWRDHLSVVSRTRRKNLPQDIDKADIDPFDELSSQRPHIPLDETHKKLIDWLKKENALWWWDQDNWMLVTHTMWLKRAHIDLGLRGPYDTLSEGKDLNHQNCFLYPMRKGSWVVRRFGRGVREHGSWSQDQNGWTRCFFNKEPDIPTAAKAYGGIEDQKGGFVFREAEVASRVATMLGVDINLPTYCASRETRLSQHKDGRLVMEMEAKDNDQISGWLRKKDKWIRIFSVAAADQIEIETKSYDDILRHVVAAGEDAGWMIQSDGTWYNEPLSHVKTMLAAQGNDAGEVSAIVGNCIIRPWKYVNKPFEDEYPGDREWNRMGARLMYAPEKDQDNLSYPTWTNVLNHCGSGLDDAIRRDPWFKQNNILSGGDYLKVWIASMIQRPYEPLPYLFFYNKEQNTGKSTFHEAISLLLVRGSVRAETALLSQQGFNEELDGSILAVIEEIDLAGNKQAYNRIKDWVTAKEIYIHPKGGTPYPVKNTLHWIQCANSHTFCPVFSGDTRITVALVKALEKDIPKIELLKMLEKEAGAFLTEILSIDLPKPKGRLALPIVETQDKVIMQAVNKTSLDTFLEEHLVREDGCRVSFAEFYDAYYTYCDAAERSKISKMKVTYQIPPSYIKGRDRKTSVVYLANVYLKSATPVKDSQHKYKVSSDGYLDEDIP